MDAKKRNKLLKIIKAQEGWDEGRAVVTVDEFFDGNDDPGSIGCNLLEHPGTGTFWKVLKSLSERDDVEEVWMEIYDLDSDWPFCERVLIRGEVKLAVLQKLTKPLEPSEVETLELEPTYSRARSIKGAIHSLWWD